LPGFVVISHASESVSFKTAFAWLALLTAMKIEFIARVAVITTDLPTSRRLHGEFPAPPDLRHALACFWVRRGSGPVRVLPDARADIVWRRGEGAVVARR
jgi:hypothetical protein